MPPPVKNRTQTTSNNRIKLPDSSVQTDQVEHAQRLDYTHELVNKNNLTPKTAQHTILHTNMPFEKQESVDSSETDSSFYMDKYLPEYMSNKHLVKPALEYFVDPDNSIYGRVKL